MNYTPLQSNEFHIEREDDDNKYTDDDENKPWWKECFTRKNYKIDKLVRDNE